MDELRAIGGGSPSSRMREIIEILAETREGAERIRRIVHGLRALAREESELGATQVESVVSISVNMAGHEIRPKAVLSTALSETPPVFADESRLSQVLVNLIVNAAQSFRDGDIDKNRIVVASGLEPDGRVCIAVMDNGPGIPANLRQRIFDPFFTTKPVGVGTGLGLSISRSIVHSLGGEIVVESEPGVGSTFRILLTVADFVSTEKAAPSVAPPGAGGAHILVVDDENAIVAIFKRLLGREHHVAGFTDSREALASIEAGERYDLVFCDLMMPHLSGQQLYERVRAIDSSLADRFVFVTGGGLDAGRKAFLSVVPNERIDKPFSQQNVKGIARRFAEAAAARVPR